MTNAPTPRETADHAELARLAEAATAGPWAYRDMAPNTYGPAFVDADDVRNLAICGEAVGRSETHGFCLQVDSEVRMANAAFIAAANPATVLSLLSEIAALRGEVEQLKTLRHQAIDRSRLWEIDAIMWETRATQAERQRDEAVELLRDFIEPYAALDDVQLFRTVTNGHATRISAARAFLANQGSDQ